MGHGRGAGRMRIAGTEGTISISVSSFNWDFLQHHVEAAMEDTLPQLSAGSKAWKVETQISDAGWWCEKKADTWLQEVVRRREDVV
ncbi:hypothetical protein NDU88_001042 [Pleurodeles waltl]|uniref:Uncharacterized protein n=1 Tax=Pleurodeles waltl TaxID=8319 RepID=A0AAV7WMF4_PLEWA|nr:hypothetical protein NDU88_001042 [Pleurodeles waltl]